MKICCLQDSRFTHADVVELIKASFAQWQEKGLESSLLKLTPESFAKRTANDTVLVAIDNTNDTLLGTTSFAIYEDKQGKRYAYNKYSAVVNTTKQKGIGSSLLEFEKQMAVNEGCCYILSDTCVHAKWSVKWHKKNGFRIIGLKSFNFNDYYSFIFRLQLEKSSLWSSPIYCKLASFISGLKTRLMYNSKGEMTLFGNTIVQIVQYLR